MTAEHQANMGDFAAISDALRQAGQDRPCLVLDLDRYQRNIALACGAIAPGVRARVVAKSLASLPMLDLAVEGLGAIGVMSFSSGMVQDLLTARPGWEQLLGKPLPIAAARAILATHPHAVEQVIWLADTEERAAQLAALAAQNGVRLRVAQELDLGLHRGGCMPGDLPDVLCGLAENPNLRLEGVMGYEPHLAKMPWPLRARAERQARRALRDARQCLEQLSAGQLVNTAGSLTFTGYGTADGVSEVSLGSILVRPTDFDQARPPAIEPALFIATPILKCLPENPIPGLEFLGPLVRKPHLVIHGGYWKATPVHPAGYGYSKTFGRSSNQEIWAGPRVPQSVVDDFAFLRPTQSEAVISEFGQIQIWQAGQLGASWPVLQTL